MVSFSRFGSNVEHLSDHLQACDSHVLQNLSEAIAKTDANMGGTEMNAALLSVLRDINNPGEIPAVMLLITDGDVWDVKNIISSAKEAGHRIFIVGVGSAPAESFLQDMARQTGGACEFVTPNENMAEAIVRMFQRMRGATLNIQREIADALFMLWVLKKTGKLGENERHSMRLINSAIKSVPDSLIAQADQKFEEWYSNN